MNLDVLSQVITAADLGTLGKDLFQHHMPDAVTEAIMLKEPLAGTTINHDLPGYLKGQIQLVVRSSTNATGDAKANRLLSVLTIHNEAYADKNGVFLMKIVYLRPRTLPIIYPRTPGNTIEWSIVFDACYLLDVSF